MSTDCPIDVDAFQQHTLVNQLRKPQITCFESTGRAMAEQVDRMWQVETAMTRQWHNTPRGR